MRDTTDYLPIVIAEVDYYLSYPHLQNLKYQGRLIQMIAAYLVEWFDQSHHQFNRTVNEVIAEAYYPGKHPRLWMAHALAEMDVAGWLKVDRQDGMVRRTSAWPEATEFHRVYHARLRIKGERRQTEEEARATVREQAILSLPGEIRDLLATLPPEEELIAQYQLRVDKRNYHKRVVQNAEVLIAFGREDMPVPKDEWEEPESIDCTVLVPGTVISTRRGGRLHGRTEVLIGKRKFCLRSRRILRVRDSLC